MEARKPRIVIIGAGMAGLVAANKLFKAAESKEIFDLCVVEGGTRIGGRIHTSEFGGNRIEMGATWIHGILGSPIHRIANEIIALESKQPWEFGPSEDPLIVAEGGFEPGQSIVKPMSNLYRKMMEFARGNLAEGSEKNEEADYYRIAAKASKYFTSNGGSEPYSIGAFLRRGLEAYWVRAKDKDDFNGCGNWSRKSLEEAIFAMYENTQRTYSSADDLLNLDFNAENEYRDFPGEQVTIAKGYMSIIESLASVLPAGMIQFGRKVSKIEWQPNGPQLLEMENCSGTRPIKLHFDDSSIMFADHVIVTVSLGVLKEGIQKEMGMFSPPLPSFKARSISRLGFGVVNKLFLQLGPTNGQGNSNSEVIPFLNMVFQRPDSELRDPKIPWWMRRTASLYPIYKNSNVLLSWFAGKEALELESLKDEEITNGVLTTISSFLPNSQLRKPLNLQNCSNGNVNSVESTHGFKFTRVLKSRWGTDPLFMGSYSYVAVGSSGDDIDSMAKPLPTIIEDGVAPLQILFAGEATHRKYYSTTHGAYFSGLREANRLLQHYHCGGCSELWHH